MKKIDIKGGKMTFGQRIDLGEILSSDKDEKEKIKESLKCLGVKVRFLRKRHMVYFIEIVEGMTFWSNQESTLLKYEPTAEERQAGIKDLSRKLGNMSTVKSIAKDYGRDPDEILRWEYGKVFGILYTNLEESKFNKKYQEVLMSKYK